MPTFNSTNHFEQWKQLFNRLRHVGLKVKLSKCKFEATPDYLVYRLTTEGILPGLDKLKAVRDSKPTASFCSKTVNY